MKKKLLKFFIIIGALALLLTIISTTQVQAVLQSNPNTHYKKKDYSQYWMTNFRNMEATGAALGLKETKNSTSMLSTSESNNLDSHMMRRTEYGAIAILSASGYGNPKKLQESTIKTTTGNETGLYYKGTAWEWIAGGYSPNVFKNVDVRYYDSYNSKNTSAKVGDALGTKDTTNPGCTGWHVASSSEWLDGGSNIYFLRGSGGLFSYYGYTASKTTSLYASRGVVVCGEGL